MRATFFHRANAGCEDRIGLSMAGLSHMQRLLKRTSLAALTDGPKVGDSKGRGRGRGGAGEGWGGGVVLKGNGPFWGSPQFSWWLPASRFLSLLAF